MQTVKKHSRDRDSSSSNSQKLGTARTMSPDNNDRLSFDNNLLDDDSSALELKGNIMLSKKIANWGDEVVRSGK